MRSACVVLLVPREVPAECTGMPSKLVGFDYPTDRDGLVLDEPEAGRRVALVLGEADPAVGVLVEQELPHGSLAEGRPPRDLDRFAAGHLDTERLAGTERPDGRFELIAGRPDLDVAERVDVDDEGLEAAVGNGGLGQRRGDERRRI